ncbi:MAG: sulfite exporter TauE/SafE family protein, partial [Pseudomonadota bacterium]
MLDVASPLHWAIIIATFLVAGGVKGVVGLGLPTVSLAAFTFAFGLKTAMALMVVPSLITNIAQMLQGPALGRLTRALWPFLVAACVGTFVGVAMLVHADERWLALLLGVLIISYALANLLPSVQRFRKPPSGSQPQAPPPQSTGPQADAGGTVTGTLVGLVNGILTGL